MVTSAAISSNTGHLSLTWQYDGDFLVSVEAESCGFSGHADGHVADDEFKQFVSSLKDLERTRQGEATFSSAMPGDFEVSIRSLDSQGHLGVQGKLYFCDYGSRYGHVNQLTFCFEFDPSDLAAFIKSVDA